MYFAAWAFLIASITFLPIGIYQLITNKKKYYPFCPFALISYIIILRFITYYLVVCKNGNDEFMEQY